MDGQRICIYNAKIILPDKLIYGCIHLEGGRIAWISEDCVTETECLRDASSFDAGGSYIMPGMIDVHSDAIEKEIQPRPNTLFPLDMAFFELEKKLAASGITTMYHSLSLSDEWGVRDNDMVVDIIKEINNLKKIRSMINHNIHLRYELTYLEGIDTLERLILEKSIDFMSYMDHTPGQGQFKDHDALKSFTMQSYGKKEKDVDRLIDKSIVCQSMIDRLRLTRLAKLAKSKGVYLASHDDDTREKIEALSEYEGVISEFPINLETAMYAKSKSLSVCVGAPNIIRGKSHNNNMKALDAIRHNAADIICSDYLPSTMLPATFSLVKEGVELHTAVNMVTLNPATALGLQHDTGSLETGKKADLLVVELFRGYPVVRKTFVNGKMVYKAGFSINTDEGVENAC